MSNREIRCFLHISMSLGESWLFSRIYDTELSLLHLANVVSSMLVDTT